MDHFQYLLSYLVQDLTLKAYKYNRSFETVCTKIGILRSQVQNIVSFSLPKYSPKNLDMYNTPDLDICFFF